MTTNEKVLFFVLPSKIKKTGTRKKKKNFEVFSFSIRTNYALTDWACVSLFRNFQENCGKLKRMITITITIAMTITMYGIFPFTIDKLVTVTDRNTTFYFYFPFSSIQMMNRPKIVHTM